MKDSNKKISLEEATIKSLYDQLEDTRVKDGVDGIVDDVLVVTDPQINSDEYDELIARASEIIEDTPEGDIPLDDTYLGQYAQLCPICGSTFIEDHILEPGTACPICLETPDAFVMVGQLAAEDEVAEDNGVELDNEEPAEDEVAEDNEEDNLVASEQQQTADNKLEENKEPIKEAKNISDFYDGFNAKTFYNYIKDNIASHLFVSSIPQDNEYEFSVFIYDKSLENSFSNYTVARLSYNKENKKIEIQLFDVKDNKIDYGKKVETDDIDEAINIINSYEYDFSVFKKESKELKETTDREIDTRKQDLYARTRQKLKELGDPNWENLIGLKDRLPEKDLQAYEKEYAEIRAIDMIHSILTYADKSNWNVDYVMNDEYMQNYIKDLGEDRVREIVQQEVDEYINNATINKDVYTDSEGVTYNSVTFKNESADKVEEAKLEERLDFKKYGIQRAPDYDFSDDGSRFTGYICNGVPISYLRDPEYGIYLSIRVDYLKGLDYDEYSKLPSYKDCDKYNGGISEQDVDLADVADICSRIKQEYEDALAEVKEVPDEEYKAETDELYNKAVKEFEEAKAAIKELDTDQLLNASDYDIKRLRDYLNSVKYNIKKWGWESASTHDQRTRRYNLQDKIKKHNREVNYWLTEIQKLVSKIKGATTESLHENKEEDIEAILEIVNEAKQLNEKISDYQDKLSVKFMARIFNQMRANGWDGKEETADKYFDEIMDKVVGKEEQGVELGESKKLDEERYYYGEIVYVQDALKSIKGSLGQAQSRLAEAMNDSAENEYSDEQVEVLKNADTDIGNLIVGVDKVNEKLEKTFPTRIRIMTPEEKAEIERRVSTGELNESVEVSEVQEIHEAIENAEDKDEIQDIIYTISDNSLEDEVQKAFDQSVADEDDLEVMKDFVIATLEDNAEYAE